MSRFLLEDPELSEHDREFARAIVALGEDLDKDGPGFDRERWKRCADVGLAGVTVAEESGGQGAGAVTAVAAFEALGYACRDNGLVFSLNAHLWSAATPIQRFGSDVQKQRWLPGLCDGTLIGVQGVTEPDSGSDAMAMTTRATSVADGFCLDGTKTFITNAPVADVFVVYATTDPDAGWAGLSAFVVERDTPGLSISEPFAKMGLEGSPMGELHLDGCTIPAENALGAVGSGMAMFNHSMEWERSFILSSALGTMRRLVEESVAYARERRQFGQPIGKFQAVSHRIADMHARTEACRALMYRLARLRDLGRPTGQLAATVKVTVSEAWVQTALDHQKNFGASGYMRDSGVEREVRDAIASRIYSGTSDMQRTIIASGFRL